jgi:NADPH:quinone reductase-like Zn-dependent oxidoreductase
MPRAVRFDHYGGSDVLQIVDVDQPQPGPGEVVVRVVVAGQLTIPIQSVYPLERVRDAYDELAARHTRGKIVLRVAPD